MPDYRAYFVGREKNFIGYRGFVSQNDGEAIEKAKELFEGPTIELWCGARLVTRIIGENAKVEAASVAGNDGPEHGPARPSHT
jgi:hypothetical protein